MAARMAVWLAQIGLVGGDGRCFTIRNFVL